VATVWPAGILSAVNGSRDGDESERVAPWGRRRGPSVTRCRTAPRIRSVVPGCAAPGPLRRPGRGSAVIRHDQGNKHDRWAIEVTIDGNRVGYLPSDPANKTLIDTMSGQALVKGW